MSKSCLQGSKMPLGDVLVVISVVVSVVVVVGSGLHVVVVDV